MNIMFLVWTLRSLILSYTLGFPLLNSTSSGSYMKTFPNVTEKNFTEYINKTNQTSPQLQPVDNVVILGYLEIQELRPDLPNQMSVGPGCSLATCAMQNLGHMMQIGDEKAGEFASNAWGPGKK